MVYIFDNIHGYIQYNNLETKFLDTLWVKRLKRIKQLGLLDHVFPSASHSRFEHSVGVSYLAEKYVNILATNSVDFKPSKQDKLCVKLAGLLHDVGHGPFSHVFDNIVINKSCKKHEQRSRDIVEDIFKEVGTSKDCSSAYMIDTIKEMIEPVTDNYKQNPLLNIVNNSLNSIDVDKFDYLQRDPRHIGLDYSFDPSRILNKSIVKNNQIIYNPSLTSNIIDMFLTRYRFHKDIYNHKTVKLIEVMLGDALLYANDHYNFSNISSKELLQYDDSIYNTLLFTNNKELAISKNILSRIETRDLYKQVWTGNDKSAEEIEDIKKDQLSNYKADDLRTINMKFNFCNGESSPLDKVYFNNNNIVGDKDSNINRLMPNVYEEKTVMIYSINT
jgi:deoxynucleoside triphosphate triphosphohydrolase SAMHD1